MPKQKTKASRRVLPKNVKFSDAIKNLTSAVSMVAELGMGEGYSRCTFQFSRFVEDVIIEPARKKMIPGFDKVKNNALRANAIGCTISGAGPSVIAFCDGNEKKIGDAMKKRFQICKGRL